ncbi:tetratricopeptide repeat protein [Hyalangium sp.]|uniref:tetratricopeptide repeat protein n=1 Tax=Hyalangium sp. TaxID=2028555 RepID=UPI002D5D54A6|nr:tetratricopeptide repeat protein [Hyalangium sp.]HYH98270.1 tetratricopeptide repeat protein [Hyalangium sp.]
MKTDLYHEGVARLKRGEVEEGRRLLEAAWAEAPDSVEIMRSLALALEMAGERTRAVELLERAHTQLPVDPESASFLAMLYLENEQDAQAERVLTPVLAAHPDHPRANLHMAMALAKTDPLSAREHAEKALRETDPEQRQQAETLLQVLQGSGPG